MATAPKDEQEELRRMVVRNLARKVAGVRAGPGSNERVPTRRLPLDVRTATARPSLSRAMRR